MMYSLLLKPMVMVLDEIELSNEGDTCPLLPQQGHYTQQGHSKRYGKHKCQKAAID